MTAIAIITRPEPPAELTGMSTDALRKALASTMARTVAQLTKLAWIVRILEERGEDLTDLRIGLVPYLRQIAYGQILPEVVFRYAEKPALVRAISALPLPDQQKIGQGERVMLALKKPDGSIDHRLVDPANLSGDQIKRVFANDHIRPLEEQLALAEDDKAKKAKPLMPTAGPVRVDRKRNGLIVGRKFVPAATIVDALALLRTPVEEANEEEDEAKHTHPISVVVTESQYEKLRQTAFDGRLRNSILIRRAMIAYGLI